MYLCIEETNINSRQSNYCGIDDETRIESSDGRSAFSLKIKQLLQIYTQQLTCTKGQNGKISMEDVMTEFCVAFAAV